MGAGRAARSAAVARGRAGAYLVAHIRRPSAGPAPAASPAAPPSPEGPAPFCVPASPPAAPVDPAADLNAGLLADARAALSAAWPVLAALGALLLPGVRVRVRGWLRDSPAEHAAALRAAWATEGATCDELFVAAHARCMDRLKPHIDGAYAPAVAKREATERDLANSVAGLREMLVKREAELARPLADLAHEIQGLSKAVTQLHQDHRETDAAVRQLGKDMARYEGENRRRGADRRRADRASAA